MTDNVGDHGLKCLNDEDYAAYALAMQCNAEATEDALSSISDSLVTAAARPWIHVTNAAVRTVSTGSGTIGPGGVVGQQLAPSATTTLVTVTANGMPTSFSPGDPTSLVPPGIYLIGATVTWTLAAATANSLRRLLVYGVPRVNGIVDSSSVVVDLFGNQDYQGDGGNNGALMVAGLLDARAGNIARVESFFYHANVAGDLSIAAGAWRLWAVQVGSGLGF